MEFGKFHTDYRQTSCQVAEELKPISFSPLAPSYITSLSLDLCRYNTRILYTNIPIGMFAKPMPRRVRIAVILLPSVCLLLVYTFAKPTTEHSDARVKARFQTRLMLKSIHQVLYLRVQQKRFRNVCGPVVCL